MTVATKVSARRNQDLNDVTQQIIRILKILHTFVAHIHARSAYPCNNKHMEINRQISTVN